MAYYDLPLEELKEYKPPRSEPEDFDDFWEGTLAEARKHELNPRFEEVEHGLVTVDAYDVTFCGFGGDDIKGWFLLPAETDAPLPCIVEYIGYGGGRGFPHDWLLWSSAGFAHLIMDTRGQGSVWRKGDTPDRHSITGPQVPGFLTQGILNPDTYYYRRVITDAARALEAARAHPKVDSARIGITGISQGGGICVALSGLDKKLDLVMPDVPFLCAFKRATDITDSHPYEEIVSFCKTHRDKVADVFRTLSYFDGVNFATRASAQAFFSVALMDTICPPSTVFAAYNHYPGPKDIRVYPYNNHEGGENFQFREKLAFLRSQWG